MENTAEGDVEWHFINDWPMRRFLLLNGILIIAMVFFALARDLAGSVNYFGNAGFLVIPLLLFVPGAGILRLMRLHGIGMTRSALYSLGLSVLSLMILGAGLNSLHYLNIVERPLTLDYIVVAFCAFMLVLSILVMRRDMNFISSKINHKFDSTLFLTIAFAILLPFVVIVATTVADFHGSRELMVYVVMAICLVPLVALSAKTKHYELLVLSLSVALLFHRALMTDFLQGYDIFSEYSAASITTGQGWWNISESLGMYGGGANTALSIVTLCPMLTNLSGINTLQALKIVYPFIFAFVPLAIYKVVQSQLDNRAAFVGACLFMSYSAFYNLMIQLGKQEIAELFLVGILVVLTQEMVSRSNKRLLLYLFIAGIMLSHYAIAFLSIIMIVGLVIFYSILLVCRKWKSWRAEHERVSFVGWGRSVIMDWFKAQRDTQLITLEMVPLFIGFFLVWFTLTGSGVALSFMGLSPSSVQSIAAGTGSAGASNLTQIDAVQSLLINSGTRLHNLDKFLVVSMQIITVIGVIFLLRNRGGRFSKVNDSFLLFGLVAAFVLLASYTIPGVSNSLYYGRVFSLTLLFLCGFLVVGVYAILNTTHIVVRGRKERRLKIRLDLSNISIWTSTIFVVILLMSGIGIINNLTGEYNTNFSLDDKVSWAIYSDSDVSAARWASDIDHRGSYIPIADWHRFPIFGGLSSPVQSMLYMMNNSDTDKLVYLSDWNNRFSYVYPLNTENGASLTYSNLSNVIRQFNGTYDVLYSTNGNSTIIYIPSIVTPMKINEPGPPIYTYDDYSVGYFLAIVGASLIFLVVASKYVLWNRRRKGASSNDEQIDHRP